MGDPRIRRLPPRPTVVLALALAFAAGACSPPEAAAEPGRAGLILGLPDGSFQSACVTFDGPEISGDGLLRATGWASALDPRNPMGPLVCAIEGEGCDFPTEDCLCRCRGVGGCSYWAYFEWDEAQGWDYSALGAGMDRVRPGDLNAWIWLDRSLPGDTLPLPPADFSFASICQ